jgi:solute carrier family 15 oligopeptide transporter 1
MAASEVRRTSRGNSFNSEVGHLSLLASQSSTSDEPFDSFSNRQDDDGTFSADPKVTRNPNNNKLFSCIPGPPWVINILLSELCERFSFYALRAILVLFFKERLGWSRDSAISIFFFSSALSYFMPLLGGYVADSKLGRFKTILGFSSIYVLGSFVLALAAATSPEPFFNNGTEISNHTSAATESAAERAASEQAGEGGEALTEADTTGSAFLAIFALCLIAVGTGGIKPNVSSFGADQFTGPTRADDIGKFFAIFYFCINTGSVISFIISPILRVNAGYGVAFALPTILLTVATVVFWSGRDKYIRKPLGKSPVAVLWNVFTTARSTQSSGSNNFNIGVNSVQQSNTSRSSHWLNKARGPCNEQDVNDTIDVWRQGAILLTLPIFWTLYDQQGSAWTLQGTLSNPPLSSLLSPLSSLSSLLSPLSPLFSLFSLSTSTVLTNYLFLL